MHFVEEDLPKYSIYPFKIKHLYFIFQGYGLPGAIVAVTVGINFENYGAATTTSSFCLMTTASFVIGVAVPFAVMFSVMIGFYLSAWCLVSTSPSHVVGNSNNEGRSTSPSSAAPSFDDGDLGTAVGGATSSRGGRKRPDKEKTVKSMLLSQAYVFLLCVSAWMCAALSTVQPLKGDFPYEELTFALLYTVSAVSYGVFAFVYFCVTRNDVQDIWREGSDCFCSKSGNPANNVSDYLRPIEAEEMSQLVRVDQYNQEMLQRQQQLNSVGGTLVTGQPFLDNTVTTGLNVDPAGPGLRQFTVNQDGFKLYDSSLNQPPPPVPSMMGRLDNNYRFHPQYSSNRQRRESDLSSDRVSLNNVNHLRRQVQGYQAPVNSEAEYGLYGGVGGLNMREPQLENIIQEPTYMYSAKGEGSVPVQPMTSSPMVPTNGNGELNELTLSPLATTQYQRTADSINEHEVYEEDVSGAPCRMASITNDEPRSPYMQNRQGSRYSSSSRSTGRYRESRRRAAAAAVANAASDTESEEDNKSSSAYSGRSTNGRRTYGNKRPPKLRTKKSKSNGGGGSSSLEHSRRDERYYTDSMGNDKSSQNDTSLLKRVGNNHGQPQSPEAVEVDPSSRETCV